MTKTMEEKVALVTGSNSFVVWPIINIIYPRLAVRHTLSYRFSRNGKGS